MKRIHLSIQEKHDQILEREAKRRNKSKSQYLRDLISKRANNKILKDLAKIQTFNCEILLQISRLSANINQIAYHLNSGFKTDPKEFFKVSEELLEHIQILREDLNKNSKLLLKVV
ncbi:hypothetical protein BKH41_08515 [Helicobacter sp. 12S02232-10]|uniref:plasmid mobilization relaxosome protein MobC n=1 Tax=Helicobacter sp. 12S02232-10 TaxID=1476197 RepID=UPI000BA7E266|nr:plasmid mobilization relaxosome protein MobC [Helicobacter sp. 12S02232-10]PAF46742.1 hypothetical protein BKH41_08515 [Helicobacter sp. 12S02232-10]